MYLTWELNYELRFCVSLSLPLLSRICFSRVSKLPADELYETKMFLLQTPLYLLPKLVVDDFENFKEQFQPAR